MDPAYRDTRLVPGNDPWSQYKRDLDSTSMHLLLGLPHVLLPKQCLGLLTNFILSFLHPIELFRIVTVSRDWAKKIAPQPINSNSTTSTPSVMSHVLPFIRHFSISSCHDFFPMHPARMVVFANSQVNYDPLLPRVVGVVPLLLSCLTGLHHVNLTQSHVPDGNESIWIWRLEQEDRKLKHDQKRTREQRPKQKQEEEEPEQKQAHTRPLTRKQKYQQELKQKKKAERKRKQEREEERMQKKQAKEERQRYYHLPPYPIPVMQLLAPLTRMTRLHTLIWNDDILHTQCHTDPSLPQLYAAGMSQLPATLTHLELRVYEPWWQDGVYQSIVSAWSPLKRLELYFHLDVTQHVAHVNQSQPHPATWSALITQHASTLKHFVFNSGHLTCREWGMLSALKQLTYLRIDQTNVLDMERGTEQELTVLSHLPALSQVYLNNFSRLGNMSPTTRDRILIPLLTSLSRIATLHTLSMRDLFLSQLAVVARAGSTFYSLDTLDMNLLDVETDRVVDVLITATPNIQHVVNLERDYTTNQILLLQQACPRLPFSHIPWTHDATKATIVQSKSAKTTKSANTAAAIITNTPSLYDEQLCQLLSSLPAASINMVTKFSLESRCDDHDHRSFLPVTVHGYRALTSFAALTELTIRVGTNISDHTNRQSDPNMFSAAGYGLTMCDDKMRIIASGLSQLSHLDIASCDAITDAGMAELPRLTHLRSLTLLDLDACTDGMWSSLTHCTSLHSMWLSGRYRSTESRLTEYISKAAHTFRLIHSPPAAIVTTTSDTSLRASTFTSPSLTTPHDIPAASFCSSTLPCGSTCCSCSRLSIRVSTPTSYSPAYRYQNVTACIQYALQQQFSDIKISME